MANEPITREEMFFAKLGGADVETPEPITRREKLLQGIIDNGVGGGASSWNDLTDKPFYEETVMGDTLTWDGDMTGKVYAEFEMPIDDEGNTTTAYFVKVSDSIPTFEDLQSGGTTTAYMGGMSQTLEWGGDKDYYYTDMGNVLLDESMQLPIIAKEDNVDVMGMFTLPEKGVYSMCAPAMGMYVGSFTINNYTGFEMVEITPIDPKYLTGMCMLVDLTNYTLTNGKITVSDINYNAIYEHIMRGGSVYIKVEENGLVSIQPFNSMIVQPDVGMAFIQNTSFMVIFTNGSYH